MTEEINKEEIEKTTPKKKGRPSVTEKNKVLEKENAEMKQSLSEMILKFEELSKKMEELSSIKDTNDVQADDKKELKKEDIQEKLSSDDYITVTSLCPHVLNVTTGNDIYRFEEFGETKNIPYSDVRLIVEKNRQFIKKGYFHISDERVLRKHGLTKDYEKILSKEDFDKILDRNNDSDESIRLFDSASDGQKNNIASILISMIGNNMLVPDLVVNHIQKTLKIKILDMGNEYLNFGKDK